MLGNIARDSFCFSLEKLSKFLKLPPTVARVALLPLGNETPNLFAGFIDFMGVDASEVGLNSVLAGASFITFVVSGLVSLFIGGSHA